MSNILDTIEQARRILSESPIAYPVFAWVDGVHYRIDSEDAEPVALSEIEDQEGQ